MSGPIYIHTGQGITSNNNVPKNTTIFDGSVRISGNITVNEITDLQTSSGHMHQEIIALQTTSGYIQTEVNNLNIGSGQWHQVGNDIFASGSANVCVSGYLSVSGIIYSNEMKFIDFDDSKNVFWMKGNNDNTDPKLELGSITADDYHVTALSISSGIITVPDTTKIITANIEGNPAIKIKSNYGAVELESQGNLLVTADNMNCESNGNLGTSGILTVSENVGLNTNTIYGGIWVGTTNEIWTAPLSTDNDAGMWINYRGYLHGTTKYRDFFIGNGKAGQVISVDGSTNDVTFAGTLGLNGNIPDPGNPDIFSITTTSNNDEIGGIAPMIEYGTAQTYYRHKTFSGLSTTMVTIWPSISEYSTYMWISGKKTATVATRFTDYIVCSPTNATPTVISAYSTRGSPAARTYAVNTDTGDLSGVMAANTYDLNICTMFIGSYAA